MKHFSKHFHLRYASMSGVLAVPKKWNVHHWCRVSLVLSLLLGLAWQTAQAQCTSIVCRGTVDNPLELAVNNSCQAVILAEEVLDMDATMCDGLKQVTVRDMDGNSLADAQTVATFDASAFINTILEVTVTDVSTSISCIGAIRLVDNMPPTIECTSTFINCNADTSIVAVGVPTINDSCDPAPSIFYSDFIDSLDCMNVNGYVVERTWVVQDASGNLATCAQPIVLTRIDLGDIVFPPNMDVSCENPMTDPADTGVPMLDGLPLESGDFCNLIINPVDAIVFTCGSTEYEITRTWTISETCNNATITGTQMIRVMDQTPPSITCPDDFVVETQPGNCSTTVNLLEPELLDNCDPNAAFFVTTSYGAVGLGPHPVVPVGSHIITYTALDECGNTSICTSMVSVVDEEAPVAVCEDQTIISLPGTGLGQVDAITFDAGSSDNCATQLFFKARRMVTGSCELGNGDDSDDIDGFQEWFDDQVLFCCDETEDSIRVLLRVYEIDPGDGPVEPTREIIGGDLFGHFTECMVQVQVQDKLFPVFTQCPADRTIDCRDDYSDLSIFGSPVVVDNCGFTIDSTEAIVIDECNLGTIIRTFRATDFSGQTAVCSQTIDIVNMNPFNEDMIVWPEDYTVFTCGASVDPEDIPEAFREPQILGDACGLVSFNYEDNVFEISFPACYKVLRTWTVLDWCRYEPEYPENGGRWSYTQILKVEDDTPPVLTCPSDVVAAVGSDCQTANVTLESLVADDCSTSLLITNNSPFGNGGGANASGTYPLGETVVTYNVSDRCGNTSSCEVTILVEDQTAPAAICIVGLSVNLTPMSTGEMMAMVDAAAFNGGGFDNCSADEDILQTIRVTPDPSVPSNIPASSTMVTFDCADVGTQFVELWLTDELGNSDYCVTYVVVQDNLGTCPAPSASGMVAGSIVTEYGETVEEVQVTLDGDTTQMLTGIDGAFEFFDIPFGLNFTVVPQKNDDILNGINTLDLILITKHILGLIPLDTPYKMIAADVDRSGSVSIGDLVVLRRLILSIEDSFPNGNTSWRFIDGNYEFPDPSNPFLEEFPEALNISNFDLDDLLIDFVGVKVGDVDQTAVPNMLAEVIDRDPDSELNLTMEDFAINAGEIEVVDITVANLSEFLGFQFTMQFDLDRIELLDLYPSEAIPEMNLSNFNFENFADGYFTASWGALNAVTEYDNTVLFSLKVRARQFAKTKEVFYVSSSRTQSEAYTLTSKPADVVLDFVYNPNPLMTESLMVDQNYPNPFREVTSILFELQDDSFIHFSVMNAAGQLVLTRDGQYTRGKHMIEIREEDLPANGVYYYKIKTETAEVSRKMVLMK
ncbi:MAG: HYR domain-containing protein [Bacteroidota bacterium]